MNLIALLFLTNISLFQSFKIHRCFILFDTSIDEFWVSKIVLYLVGELSVICLSVMQISGFSHTDSAGLVTDQDQVAANLYEMLTQFFTIFPEFRPNDFFVFGESYAGKYVPSISRKIHDENPTAANPINLKGLGIGNGAMDPVNSDVYAEFLYQVNRTLKASCKAAFTHRPSRLYWLNKNRAFSSLLWKF